MSWSDSTEIIAVAAVCAALAGALGLAAAWLTRSWSIRWHILLVAAVAAGGTYAGALAIARLMFLSAHDLTVMTMVSSVSALVAVAVALIVGSTVSGWSARVRAQVRSLGPGGDTVVSGGGPQELRALSAELAQTQRRLDEARVRETRLEDSRRELVSWVSHDLRTPLAGLRAMAEALEDGLATDVPRYHRQIRTEVDRMAAMVDDLFELSRIHAGVLTLAPEPVALGDLVSEALAGADPLARACHVRLGGRVDDGLEISADSAGLSRVLSNLIMNAIRHTPADGLVEIRGRRVDDVVQLTVSDGCGGLSPDTMARVFDLAWQGEPARTPSDPALGHGAGLGLAIVKGIVEAHRGSVQVENDASARGCRFLVTLPA